MPPFSVAKIARVPAGRASSCSRRSWISNAGEWDRLGLAALVQPSGDEDRAAVEVDAVVRERDGLGEAEADGAAERDDPLDALRQPRGEAEQFLVFERLTLARLPA